MIDYNESPDATWGGLLSTWDNSSRLLDIESRTFHDQICHWHTYLCSKQLFKTYCVPSCYQGCQVGYRYLARVFLVYFELVMASSTRVHTSLHTCLPVWLSISTEKVSCFFVVWLLIHTVANNLKPRTLVHWGMEITRVNHTVPFDQNRLFGNFWKIEKHAFKMLLYPWCHGSIYRSLTKMYNWEQNKLLVCFPMM